MVLQAALLDQDITCQLLCAPAYFCIRRPYSTKYQTTITPLIRGAHRSIGQALHGRGGHRQRQLGIIRRRRRRRSGITRRTLGLGALWHRHPARRRQRRPSCRSGPSRAEMQRRLLSRDAGAWRRGRGLARQASHQADGGGLAAPEAGPPLGGCSARRTARRPCWASPPRLPRRPPAHEVRLLWDSISNQVPGLKENWSLLGVQIFRVSVAQILKIRGLRCF